MLVGLPSTSTCLYTNSVVALFTNKTNHELYILYITVDKVIVKCFTQSLRVPQKGDS